MGSRRKAEQPRAATVHRRHLIALSSVLAAPGAAARVLDITPAQAAGPFYPSVPPLDDDNDLVQVAGQPRPAMGTVLDLHGHVLRPDGSAVAGAQVEIWQCDANGRYHHARDRGDAPLDGGFQGYGRTRTRADGGYRFRTIRPVPYPGRTPHIHFAATAPGERPFVTQMYVRGEPRNERDFLYQRIPAPLRDLVTVSMQIRDASPSSLWARFDLVIPG